MRIRYTEAADADLDRLLAETAARWPHSLGKTVDRLRTFERVVARFPKAGRRTRFADVRTYSLAPLPYGVFYRLISDEIEVLRIYHAARRPFDPGRS